MKIVSLTVSNKHLMLDFSGFKMKGNAHIVHILQISSGFTRFVLVCVVFCNTSIIYIYINKIRQNKQAVSKHSECVDFHLLTKL